MDEFAAEAVELTTDSGHGCFAVVKEGRCYFHPFLQWVVLFSTKPRRVYLVDAEARRTLETEVKSIRYLLCGLGILILLVAYLQDVAFLKKGFLFYFAALYYGGMKIMLHKHLKALPCVEGVISPTAAYEKATSEASSALMGIVLSTVLGVFAWLYAANFPSWLSISVVLILAGWFLRSCYRLGRISFS